MVYELKSKKLTEPLDELSQRDMDSIINPKVKPHLDVMPEHSNYPTE